MAPFKSSTSEPAAGQSTTISGELSSSFTGDSHFAGSVVIGRSQAGQGADGNLTVSGSIDTGKYGGITVGKAGNFEMHSEGFFRRSPTRYYLEEFFTKRPQLHATLYETKDGGHNFGSLGDGAYESTTITVTGAVLGDFAMVSLGVDTVDMTVTAAVTATDTVTVTLTNTSGGTVDLADTTLAVRVIKATGAFVANEHFQICGQSGGANTRANYNVLYNAADSGIKLLTGTSGPHGTYKVGDQMIVIPSKENVLLYGSTYEDVSAWRGIQWRTEHQVEWECAITTGAITNVGFWAGLGLTTPGLPSPERGDASWTYAADDDQAMFFFCTDTTFGALTTPAKLHFIYSIGDTDYITNTGITVSAYSHYVLRIRFTWDRKINIWVQTGDGEGGFEAQSQQGITTAEVGGDPDSTGGVVESSNFDSLAMTNDKALIPMIGIQSLNADAGGHNITIHYQKISRKIRW